MKPLKKSNEHLVSLIKELHKVAAKENVGLWKAVAINLAKPTRIRPEVNIYKLNKLTKENEYVVVPGKVLATGELDHKINVAAYNFSSSAREKISQKGSVMTIQELMVKNPKGTGVKIIK